MDESLGGNPEGYRLTVNEKGIDLKAATEAGLFYGEQTLRQLFSPRGFPYVTIQDEPRFKYRGMHLDVSRHFFPKEEVFKLLDVMSFYKLNNLHLHLTDAGGWRIRMDKYPKLTTETAFRTESDWRNGGMGKIVNICRKELRELMEATIPKTISVRLLPMQHPNILI